MQISSPNKIPNWKQNGKAHKYMTHSYMRYILVHRTMMYHMFDEYIYWLNRGLGSYKSRIKQPIANIPDGLTILHLKNFSKLVREIKDVLDGELTADCVNVTNKKIVMNFYGKILSLIDEGLGEKYYYGRAITEDEWENILELSNRKYPDEKFQCDYDWIELLIPSHMIENYPTCEEKLNELIPNKVRLVIIDDYDLKVEIDNRDRIFHWGTLWDIIDLCTSGVLYFQIENIMNDECVLQLSVTLE